MGTWKKLAYFDDVVDKTILTEQGSIPYANAASTWAELLHGIAGQYLKSGGHAANPSWDTPAGGAQVKVKAETKDMTETSRDNSYTGYGFTPTGLIIYAYSSAWNSHGVSSPAKAYIGWVDKSGTYIGPSTSIILEVGSGATDYQTAILKSYDADGYTLTWTKTNSPTGTANLIVFAFK